MVKIAKGVNKINFTMLYGNYCYIIIENFPKKFSPCRKRAIIASAKKEEAALDEKIEALKECVTCTRL